MPEAKRATPRTGSLTATCHPEVAMHGFLGCSGTAVQSRRSAARSAHSSRGRYWRLMRRAEQGSYREGLLDAASAETSATARDGGVHQAGEVARQMAQTGLATARVIGDAMVSQEYQKFLPPGAFGTG